MRRSALGWLIAAVLYFVIVTIAKASPADFATSSDDAGSFFAPYTPATAADTSESVEAVEAEGSGDYFAAGLEDGPLSPPLQNKTSRSGAFSEQNPAPWADGRDPSYRFIRVRGTQLVSTDVNNSFYFVGMNFWAGAYLAASSSSTGGAAAVASARRTLEAELDALLGLGITHLRILAASEGPDSEPWRISPSLQPCPGRYNDNVLDGLDWLILQLGRRRIRTVCDPPFCRFRPRSKESHKKQKDNDGGRRLW